MRLFSIQLSPVFRFFSLQGPNILLSALFQIPTVTVTIVWDVHHVCSRGPKTLLNPSSGNKMFTASSILDVLLPIPVAMQLIVCAVLDPVHVEVAGSNPARNMNACNFVNVTHLAMV